MQTPFGAVDLFAGPGGWDVAARALGISSVGFEWDDAAMKTRAAADLTTVHGDVREQDPTAWPAFGLIASPPCQTFSKLGRGHGRLALEDLTLALDDIFNGAPIPDFEDDRTSLVLEPMRWVKRAFQAHQGYHWIAMEQVPSVLPVWEHYAELLTAMGYAAEARLVSSEMYGVPQVRKRAVLMAHKDVLVWPEPTHSQYHVRSPERLDPGVPRWVTMADAIRVHESAWEPNFHMQSESKYDPEWPFKRPSTTVAGRSIVQNPGATANRYNGSTKSRNDGVVLNQWQAGVVQTFPSDYPWQGSVRQQYQQIGNAIPPRLAYRILEQLI